VTLRRYSTNTNREGHDFTACGKMGCFLRPAFRELFFRALVRPDFVFSGLFLTGDAPIPVRYTGGSSRRCIRRRFNAAAAS
jgi:hypothetical protein